MSRDSGAGAYSQSVSAGVAALWCSIGHQSIVK